MAGDMPASFARTSAPTLFWGDRQPRSGASVLPPFDYAKADDRELASLGKLCTGGHRGDDGRELCEYRGQGTR